MRNEEGAGSELRIPNSTFRISVLLFAHLRDRLGPSVAVELPAGATVADLRARLPIEGCRVAVNLTFAEDGDVIPPGAEVAVIPPVSGG